jgi:Antibiotic biosynthesis monooxygenase
MVIVAGTIELDPDQRETFLAGRIDGMRTSRAEPGCLEYTLSADPTDPRRVMLFEALGASGRPRRSLGRVASAPGIARNRGGPKGGLDLRLRRYRRAAVGEVKVAIEPITCEVAQQRKLRIPSAAVAVRATLIFSRRTSSRRTVAMN